MKSRRLLVTGAAGFIGAALSEQLVGLGFDVLGLDSFTPYYDRSIKERNVAKLRTSPRFTLIEADLCTAPLAPLLVDVTGILHLAGQPGVTQSWGTAFRDFADNNVVATQRLLEAAVSARIERFIYASSSSVYGNAVPLPTAEQARCAPHSPYGVTKLAGEHLVELYRTNHGLSAATLRYFTAYGPRQRPDMAWHKMIRAARREEKLLVRGDGQQTRDFTFVDDIVQANLLALDSDVTGAFNVGGGSRVTVLEALALIERILGTPLKLQHVAALKGDVDHTHADTSRARELLGYSPKTSLEDGLRAQVEWHLRADEES
jgi:nucleoside-diphosphate-sugar epimerase